ncbi:MAG: hypothetical protein M3305_06695 [Actinomycetota bacterium]|nr:hypothetical protein [Actinomycetota bacterium]
MRTNLKIAHELVERLVEMGVDSGARVAGSSFYGEDRGFERFLEDLGAAYVMSLNESHCAGNA